MATRTKKPEKATTHLSRGAHAPVFRARAERLATGQLLRNSVPRASHADWKPPTNRRDPIEILEASNQGRLPDLVPIRYGRMLHSPFTFLRGSAALMADDLATTPTSGIRVQACGDCHLLNFGLFATPERHLVFDVNDFDETHAAPDAKARRAREQIAAKARHHVVEHLSPKIAGEVGGRLRLVDQPPVLFHVPEADWEERVQEGLSAYRQSLSDERRVLLDRYRLEDSALKVVGIGSVGTRCAIALLASEEHHPLILQFKEAGRSVLEPCTDRSPYNNQGQRVVVGQRLMQSSSDIFLGWVRGRQGYDFYVRQLRDMKMSYPIEGMTAVQLTRYAEICGRTLGRAHAKSGDAATISGYLGKGDNVDRAMRTFALAYADQTEQDHAALVKAVRDGRVEALAEE
jgi:uncharacterized protein (DUF2252 family)